MSIIFMFFNFPSAAWANIFNISISNNIDNRWV